MNIILLGAPGSGKGTQAETLKSTLGLTHIATGDLFRYNLKNETPLGLKAKAYMDKGQLVPDDVTIAMVRERLQEPDAKQGILFDGFPRTPAQAEALTTLMAELGMKIDRVIYLRVPDEEIIERLSGRLICKECQVPFHKTFNPFKTCPSGKCHGEFLYQRDDDKPEVVRARLDTFHTQTAPLVEYYQKAGVLANVPGSGDIEVIKQAIINAVK
ncbi:MAG: adenylate kinase [Chloroflexota bacterium]|jgi:adenylate kinase